MSDRSRAMPVARRGCAQSSIESFLYFMNLELQHTIETPDEATICTTRRGTRADASALAAFAARTFTETYGRYNDPENLNLHIACAFTPMQQANELADPNVATLLAHHREELAAYAQVRRGPAPACVTGNAPVELHRFYVDSIWHGHGIGQRLLADVRAAALTFGGATLWLKVWEHNARAIAFYRKSKFTDVGTADFFVGRDRQTDRVLVMQLCDTNGI